MRHAKRAAVSSSEAARDNGQSMGRRRWLCNSCSSVPYIVQCWGMTARASGVPGIEGLPRFSITKQRLLSNPVTNLASSGGGATPMPSSAPGGSATDWRTRRVGMMGSNLQEGHGAWCVS